MRMLLALAALSLSVPVVAQTNVATATSPSGILTLTITINGEGRVGYAVARGSTPVIGESHLGFLFSDSRQMLRNMELKGKTEAKVDTTWEQPWGEWRQVRDHHDEVALTFQEKDKLRRTMRVRFRLFDDAVVSLRASRTGKPQDRQHGRGTDAISRAEAGPRLVGAGV